MVVILNFCKMFITDGEKKPCLDCFSGYNVLIFWSLRLRNWLYEEYSTVMFTAVTVL